MGKRRGHGEGAIYHRASDDRWVASIVLPTGKKKYLYGKNRSEVLQKLKKAQLEQEQGKLVTVKDQSLKDFLEYWLSVKKMTVKNTTYTAYYRRLKRHVLPLLGRTTLQKLTGDMLQHLYAQMGEDGLAASSIAQTHAILSSAFNDAVKWKKISFNPCKDATHPRQIKQELHILDPEQARRLLEVAQQEEKLVCLLTLAITTGMRKGEILALRWSDIDFTHNTLKVQRTVSYLPKDQGEKHVFQETSPKTASSRRNIALPQFVVDAFHHHRARQLEMRLKIGESWQENGLVFCNRKGTHYGITTLSSQLKKLLEKAGLPDIRFHDLRHSAATLLLAMGIHPKVVQELLGHSTICMTMDLYSHMLPSLQREAMTQLNTLFKGTDQGGSRAQ